MVKRTASGDNEPDQSSFDLPSQKEHLLQVVDVFDMDTDGNKFNLDPNTVIAKLEVVGGTEEGRTMLNRLSLDDKYKGFFATRLFLKACSLEYKGDNFAIDTDEWPGCQLYATVIHIQSKGKTYANIKEYNFEKMVDNSKAKNLNKPKDNPVSDEVAWDSDIK